MLPSSGPGAKSEHDKISQRPFMSRKAIPVGVIHQQAMGQGDLCNERAGIAPGPRQAGEHIAERGAGLVPPQCCLLYTSDAADE